MSKLSLIEFLTSALRTLVSITPILIMGIEPTNLKCKT